METDNSLIRKLKLASVLALTALLLLSGVGCAKNETNPAIKGEIPQVFGDKAPPVFQDLKIPQYSLEGEKIGIEVTTYDDRGTQKVDIYLNNELIETLTKKDTDKTQGEKAIWQGNIELPVGDNSFSIVAEDNAGNKSEPKEVKIIIYSKNSVYGYAQGKGIDIYLSQLLDLEKDGIVDQNDKAFIDLVVKYPKAGELVPGIYNELIKFDERDIAADEEILALASDPQNKQAFESMLDEGIPEKRQFCTPLLMLSYDIKNPTIDIPGLLKDYSVEKLWKKSFKQSEFYSKHLKSFEDATVTLNSPILGYLFEKNSLQFTEGDPYMSPTPLEVFNSKASNCIGCSVFLEYCSEKNGYDLDKFDNNPETIYPPNDKFEIHKTNATCMIATNQFTEEGILKEIGHDVVAEIKDGKIYLRDATGWWRSTGPFNSIKDMIETNYPGEFYIARIQDYHAWRAGGLILSESFKEKIMEDKSFKVNFMEMLKASPYNDKENIEYNKWAIEYLDGL